MGAEPQILVRCDAPHCDRTLEGADGHVLFSNAEEALDTAETQNWLVTFDQRIGRREQKTYCPTHWHTTFGVRQPYWGVKRRRLTTEETRDDD